MTNYTNLEDLGKQYSDKVALSRSWELDPLEKDLSNFKRFTAALKGKKVLDLGCGYGQYVNDFIEAGLTYHGIDHSPKMIQVARASYPDAKFDVMSLNKLALMDNSFDGIWAAYSICTTPKDEFRGSLRTIKDKLVTGGVMLVAVPYLGESKETLVENALGQFWYATYTPEEFRAMFIKTGFSSIEFFEDFDDGAMSVMVTK